MKLFIDTANIEEIKYFSKFNMIDGVTTNPTLIAKEKTDFIMLIKQICSIINGPVSAEVIAIDADSMIQQGRFLRNIASNVVIKLPCTHEGILACKTLSKNYKIPVNMTLCFSSSQAILAAKAGARYISPFIGRLDDIGENGILLVEEICQIYDIYDYETEVLAASIRSTEHINKAALVGVDICTCPPNILNKMIDHDLTKAGLKKFMDDWRDSGLIINNEN